MLADSAHQISARVLTFADERGAFLAAEHVAQNSAFAVAGVEATLDCAYGLLQPGMLGHQRVEGFVYEPAVRVEHSLWLQSDGFGEAFHDLIGILAVAH